MWVRSECADWKKNIVGSVVGRKFIFPKSRSIGMTYVRALLDNAAVKDNL